MDITFIIGNKQKLILVEKIPFTMFETAEAAASASRFRCTLAAFLSH
jgi:hypothetical protein